MLLATAVLYGWLSVVGFVSAQTWTQTSAPTNDWRSIASSADGKILAAAVGNPAGGSFPIYVSTNSGADWTSNSASDGTWLSIASSADGTKLVAVGSSPNGNIITSTNSGTTWIKTNEPNNGWESVASSADGSKLIAGTDGGIYTSMDFGNTWTSNNIRTADWISVASSADGMKLFANWHPPTGYSGGPPPSTLSTSTNASMNWTYLTNGPDAISVCCSCDGTKLAAAYGRIVTSTNSGLTWQLTSAPNAAFSCIASSADGTKLVASAGVYASTGPIYTSTDSGNTWTSNNAPNQVWTSVASSADGNKLVAVAFNGGIWTSQTMPTPQLNIAPTNSNLNLSWIVPSTNFVLQQSFDLSNWNDVTDAPALNLTNLQDEVIQSPTNGSSFYRLESF